MIGQVQNKDGLLVFIPVRVNSTRLPKKALMPLSCHRAYTILEFLIDRVQASGVGPVVLCITADASDDVLAEIADRHGIECSRGPEGDIIRQYSETAHQMNAELVINVDGDDSLCDPELIRETASLLRESDMDFIAWKDLPLGLAPCGMRAKALHRVCAMKRTNNTQTGWTRYFTLSGSFRSQVLRPVDPRLCRPELRLTLDYPEDFEVIRQVCEGLCDGFRFTALDIVEFLDCHPHLASLNAHLNKTYWEAFERNAVKIELKGEAVPATIEPHTS